MDVSQREGHYPPPPGSSSILGVEFSGHVAELGPDVSEWKIGDEVLGLAGGVSGYHNPQSIVPKHIRHLQGAYAEYIAVKSTNVVKKPTHLSWVEAASIPENFLTGERQPSASFNRDYKYDIPQRSRLLCSWEKLNVMRPF